MLGNVPIEPARNPRAQHWVVDAYLIWGHVRVVPNAEAMVDAVGKHQVASIVFGAFNYHRFVAICNEDRRLLRRWRIDFGIMK
jgi:hypothetical protein